MKEVGVGKVVAGLKAFRPRIELLDGFTAFPVGQCDVQDGGWWSSQEHALPQHIHGRLVDEQHVDTTRNSVALIGEDEPLRAVGFQGAFDFAGQYLKLLHLYVAFRQIFKVAFSIVVGLDVRVHLTALRAGFESGGAPEVLDLLTGEFAQLVFVPVGSGHHLGDDLVGVELFEEGVDDARHREQVVFGEDSGTFQVNIVVVRIMVKKDTRISGVGMDRVQMPRLTTT